MQASLKFALVAAATCFLGSVAAVPSMAQPRYALQAVPAVPYSVYQGPDGSYNSQAAYVRDVNGTPCGMTCTRAAEKRWSHYDAR